MDPHQAKFQVGLVTSSISSFDTKPSPLVSTMITDNQLDSLATGLGLTMMALIIVSQPNLFSCMGGQALTLQVYHFISVNAGSDLKTASTAVTGATSHSRQKTTS